MEDYVLNQLQLNVFKLSQYYELKSVFIEKILILINCISFLYIFLIHNLIWYVKFIYEYSISKFIKSVNVCTIK